LKFTFKTNGELLLILLSTKWLPFMENFWFHLSLTANTGQIGSNTCWIHMMSYRRQTYTLCSKFVENKCALFSATWQQQQVVIRETDWEKNDFYHNICSFELNNLFFRYFRVLLTVTELLLCLVIELLRHPV